MVVLIFLVIPASQGGCYQRVLQIYAGSSRESVASYQIFCAISKAHMGIHYLAGAPILPYGFFDASWAGDLDGRPSTSGYLFTLGSGPVSWCSKK
jgi:hypothetical protein